MSQAPLTSWHFAGPELEDHHLKPFDMGLISATALHARRRMGKTEFLTQDLTPAAVEHGLAVGYCNLWQEDEDPTEAIAEAVAACSGPGRALAKVPGRLDAARATPKGWGKVRAFAEGGA